MVSEDLNFKKGVFQVSRPVSPFLASLEQKSNTFCEN